MLNYSQASGSKYNPLKALSFKLSRLVFQETLGQTTTLRPKIFVKNVFYLLWKPEVSVVVESVGSLVG